jgi:uncharacterized protein (TIGR02246 family)
MKKLIQFIALVILSFTSSLHALEPSDRRAIQEIIQGHMTAWNEHEGVGLADGFSEDASFVNIVGLSFTGKAEIEDRHVKILRGFLKGSTFKILNIDLREVQEGLVIALVRWRVDGFRNPGSSNMTQDGIFTHVFVNKGQKWEITAAQNTLVPQ